MPTPEEAGASLGEGGGSASGGAAKTAGDAAKSMAENAGTGPLEFLKRNQPHPDLDEVMEEHGVGRARAYIIRAGYKVAGMDVTPWPVDLAIGLLIWFLGEPEIGVRNG